MTEDIQLPIKESHRHGHLESHGFKTTLMNCFQNTYLVNINLIKLS